MIPPDGLGRPLDGIGHGVFVFREADPHIAAIGLRVKDLRRLQRILNAMVSQGRGDETVGCPILDALAGAPARRGLAKVAC